jgi:hypothetical protein
MEEDNDVNHTTTIGDHLVPPTPMLQITVLLPHDPDTATKVGRIVTDVLALNGRVVDIFPWHRPAPSLPPVVTPGVGDITGEITGENPAVPPALVGGRPRRNSG